MAILVTGGAGYIGSHTCVELLQEGYDIVIVDNFSNSRPDIVNRIRLMTDRDLHYYKIDLQMKTELESVFQQHEIDAVIHFAGLKSVAESVADPLRYYMVNLTGTLNLLAAMEKYHVSKLVFSSTAAVYGKSDNMPIREDAPLQAANPYGRTKQMIEQIISDYVFSRPDWGAVLLRYFNPVGAHPSGEIGENPSGIPDNLMPYITQVAAGELPQLSIFGADYPTRDGTGVRDYIHVADLAKGHVKAVEYTLNLTGVEAVNLGTGKGYSVLELIDAFEKITGNTVPYKIAGRRPGDVAESYADPAKAERLLNWKAEKGLEDMCRDAWNWQQQMNGAKNGR